MNIHNNIYTVNKLSYRTNYTSAPVSFKAKADFYIQDLPENEVIQYISSNNDPNNYCSQNENGDTILHALVKAEYFYAAKQILQSPSRAAAIINIRNKKGETALDLAKSPKMQNLLIAKKAKSGNQFPAENANVSSARIQVSKPDLMNVFKKKPETETYTQPEIKIIQEELPEIKAETVNPLKKKETELKTETTQSSAKSRTKAEGSSKKEPADFPKELKDFPKLKYLPGDPEGLDDVIGLEEIKDELNKSIIRPLTEKSAGNLLNSNGISLPNGILIIAPAGNGRTHLTKALSAQTKLPVIELADPHTLPLMMDAVEKIFNEKHQRTILFIRGIDNFVGNEGCGTRQNVSCFVRNLTNSAKRGALIVATTQDKNNVNKNILIPGIIDKTFKITVPDETARTELIKKYIENKPVFNNLNNPEIIKTIVEHTAGFSVSQLKHVIDESARSTASEGNIEVELSELLNEIKIYSKEQDIPEINEFNKTSMYDTVIKREQYKKDDPQCLSDVGGMNDVKEKITEKIIEPWKHKDEMDKFGIGMPDGVLFYGPPGSGKTYIVKGIARELGLPLYTMPLSKVASSFRHETSKKIKEITTQLHEKYLETGEASVLFLDELDSLGKAKDGNNSGSDDDEVNTLLQELDNAGDKGIIVIAATNKLDKIEGALSRDGRLGERIYVGYADFDSRVQMIKKILGSKPVTEQYAADNEYMEKLAKDFEDMPSGSISKVIKEATYQMAIKGQPFEKSIEEAYNNYQEKELDDHLTRKGIKNRGNYLKLGKSSTIKYDTTYDRTFLSDNEPHDFSELGGMQDVKGQIQKHIIDMWKPEVIAMFKENNIPMPGGVILSGPSGNGKTTIVRAAAGEMGIPLYEMDYGKVGDSYIHATSRKERELFDQLAYKFKKTGEISMILFDEIDKFVPQRKYLGSKDEYKKEEVSEMLSMMNDASENGIILIGTTNNYDMIEDAVKNNPRRMGINIHVGPPDEASRMGIITKTLAGKPIAEGLLNEQSLKKLSDIFEGCTIGRMTDTLRKAIINSLINKQELSIETIQELLNSSKGT